MKNAFWSVPKEWPGETVFIIAGGPSVTQEQVDKLKGRRVIAIKLSIEKCPWADVLFYADAKFFKPHKALIRGFAGRVVTVSPAPPDEKNEKVKVLIKHPQDRNDFVMKDQPDTLEVCWTSVTGAMKLAYLFNGGAPQVLLGVDGSLGPGKRTHHHTPHPLPHKPLAEIVARQKRDFQIMAAAFKSRGVKVFNANSESAFRMFDFIDLDAALRL